MKTTTTTHIRTAILTAVLGCVLVGLPRLTASQQTPAPVDEEEQMDAALRTFGYVSGQACQCQTSPADKTTLERQGLDIANGILRLFGSDQAFYYAAAFGAGVSANMERAKCPETITRYREMLAKLKTLAAR